MQDTAKPAIITYEDFAKIDLRTATIVEATEHPKADKLVVLKVNMGDGTERQIVAGIKQHYTPEELKGMQVIIVANLEPREVRGVRSEGMLLAAEDPDGIEKKLILMGPTHICRAGAKVQ